MSETETVDRLFLDLSQFTKAKTAREIVLESLARRSLAWISETVELATAEGTTIDSLARGSTALVADLRASLTPET